VEAAMLIGGEWRQAGAGEEIEVVNPATEEVVGTVPAARPEHVRDAFAKAKAFRPTLTRYERQQILLKTAELLVARKEELSRLITLESGLCLKDSLYEVGRAFDVFTFAGQLSAQCQEQARYYSVLSPQVYTAGLFRMLWGELGGRLHGTVREGIVPPGATLVARQESPALSELVRDINKYSNNVMARQLFLTLGAVGENAPASADKSNRVIKQWLAAKGLSFPELVLENGSGLSRIERITARHMGELLLAAYGSPVMPELVASLPLTAVDGTMRKRLSRNLVAGQAHIKTGSLSNVRSIAGYLLDSRGRRVVVVFFVNHANAGNAQPVQDALLQWVYQRGDDACCTPRRR